MKNLLAFMGCVVLALSFSRGECAAASNQPENSKDNPCAEVRTGFDWEQQTHSWRGQHPECMPEEFTFRIGIISSADLHRYFVTDEERTRRQYIGKRIAVAAVVDDMVESAALGRIDMVYEPFSRSRIILRFPESDRDLLTEMPHGKPVVAIGTVKDFTNESHILLLEDCVFSQWLTAYRFMLKPKQLEPRKDPCEGIRRMIDWNTKYTALQKVAHPECKPVETKAESAIRLAEEVLMRFKENEAAAKEKYAGKRITIADTVYSVKIAPQGNPELIYNEAPLGRIRCRFPKNAEAQLAKLPGMALIGVTGTVKGLSPDKQELLLEKCVLEDLKK